MEYLKKHRKRIIKGVKITLGVLVLRKVLKTFCPWYATVENNLYSSLCCSKKECCEKGEEQQEEEQKEEEGMTEE
jgi:hypothetical protein